MVGTKPSTWRERRKFEPLRIGAVVHLGNEESEVEVALCNGDLRFLVQALSTDAPFDHGVHGYLDGESQAGR
ncbi:MAG TPA: hypothetical protein VGP70_08905 [Actinomadura sp.]|jgi:hypothetical protein|nr:hypothetical protein [Actinomadura sp.]